MLYIAPRFFSYVRRRQSSDMMKLQGLIATMRSLFGGHRPTFGFVVLPFVGVMLFPSPAICWSYVAPQSNHLMELGQGIRLEGTTC